jgi:hypothetical protein
VSNEPLELFKIHDRTIPNRRERMEREEIRVTREMIRDIARAGSASEAAREATNDGH